MTRIAEILSEALGKQAKDPPLLIPIEESRHLLNLSRDRAGLSDVDLGRLAGSVIKKQGEGPISRLMRGTASFHLGHKVWKALDALGVSVPPLIVDATPEQRRWIAAGEKLRELAPAEFTTELALHEDRVELLTKRAAEREVQVTELEGTRVYGAWNQGEPKPLRRDRAAEDRGPGYSAKPDGSKDKGKVGSARKPPRSDGR